MKWDQTKIKNLVLSVVKLAYKRCLIETEKNGMVLQEIKNLDEWEAKKIMWNNQRECGKVKVKNMVDNKLSLHIKCYLYRLMMFFFNLMCNQCMLTGNGLSLGGQ